MFPALTSAQCSSDRGSWAGKHSQVLGGTGAECWVAQVVWSNALARLLTVLAVCYRRRFHRLKNEFAHVHYRANPTHSQVAANEENLYSYPGELIGGACHYDGGGGGTVTLAPQFVGPVGQLADYDELKVKHDWFNQSTRGSKKMS